MFEVLKLYILTSSASDCTPSAMTSRTVAVRAEPKRMQHFEALEIRSFRDNVSITKMCSYFHVYLD